MSGSGEQQTCHDPSCSLCIASHGREVRNDMGISVYSCQDERSGVSSSHPQIRTRLPEDVKLWKNICKCLMMCEEVSELFIVGIHRTCLHTILFCYRCFANGLPTPKQWQLIAPERGCYLLSFPWPHSHRALIYRLLM